MSTPNPLEPTPHERPAVWIVLCCVLAAAVVDVGIRRGVIGHGSHGW
jgi:hypothetical protein